MKALRLLHHSTLGSRVIKKKKKKKKTGGGGGYRAPDANGAVARPAYHLPQPAEFISQNAFIGEF